MRRAKLSPAKGRGAGTILHEMIKSWTNEDITTGCGCLRLIKQMDADVVWAKANIQTIVEHMAREAQKRRSIVVPQKEGRRTRWWKVLLAIPGAPIALRPFLTWMVNRAITQFEQEESQRA